MLSLAILFFVQNINYMILERAGELIHGLLELMNIVGA